MAKTASEGGGAGSYGKIGRNTKGFANYGKGTGKKFVPENKPRTVGEIKRAYQPAKGKGKGKGK